MRRTSDGKQFSVTVHTVVFREVFSCAFCTKNPELYGAKRRFFPFLCIAKRVIVRGTPLFGGV